MVSSKMKFTVVLALFQVLFLVLFGVFATYDFSANKQLRPLMEMKKAAMIAEAKAQTEAEAEPAAAETAAAAEVAENPAAEPAAVTPAAGTESGGDGVAKRAADDGAANALDTDGAADKEDGGAHEEHAAPEGPGPIKLYPMFQDVHVMIFIGFGFLMTFLKRYGFGAVGLNFLLASFVLQWAMLVGGFLGLSHSHLPGKILVSVESLLLSDFAAAAVLISFGAVLGKTSPLQLLIMAFIEIICFAVNEHIGLEMLQVADLGGSMFVHAFGAYFGMSVARVLYRKDTEESSKEASVYHSDLFAMIGTLFLWVYWPSFNSALAGEFDQDRAVINTYIALSACCLTTFLMSSALDKHGRFDMVLIQNATLAGGVAVGTSADMMLQPLGAALIGVVAAIVSSVGYKYITPFLSSKLKIHDTCGVNNLHGMPAILAGIAAAITTACADDMMYGESYSNIWSARKSEMDPVTGEVIPGRSAAVQAGFQMAALGITLLFAVVTGALTGLVLKLPLWDQPKGKYIFDDGPWYETPDDFNQDLNEQNGQKMHSLMGKDQSQEESGLA